MNNAALFSKHASRLSSSCTVSRQCLAGQLVGNKTGLQEKKRKIKMGSKRTRLLEMSQIAAALKGRRCCRRHQFFEGIAGRAHDHVLLLMEYFSFCIMALDNEE